MFAFSFGQMFEHSHSYRRRSCGTYFSLAMGRVEDLQKLWSIRSIMDEVMKDSQQLPPPRPWRTPSSWLSSAGFLCWTQRPGSQRSEVEPPTRTPRVLTFFWSFANLFSYFETFFRVGLMLGRGEESKERLSTKVATRDINFGISIKVPQKVDLNISQILRKLLNKNFGVDLPLPLFTF